MLVVFYFKCNYVIFYRELLECWLEFRNLFLANKERLCIIWNNKDIRIDGKPVFYKSYYDSGICIIKDLLFNLDNIESFNAINNIVEKANFLTWTGLRHAIPSMLKTIEYTTFTENTYFTKGNEIFDIAEKKTKDYYSLIISNKAQLPSNAKNLKHDFGLSDEDLKIAYNLPHLTAQEPYVKSFQYKVLNSILYTNAKLFKIGYLQHDKCTFCKTEQETLCHFLFYCRHSNMLWKNVEQYYLTITKEFHGLCLREVIIGITMSKCPLLNYLILIGKLYLWDCRKKQVLPNIEGFKFKVRIKYQVEKYISTKNNKLVKPGKSALGTRLEKWPKDISPL